MNKLFFILGFLIPIPLYFNDTVAELIQNMGGNLWVWFSGFGIIFYPIYLALFVLPIYFIVSLTISKLTTNFLIKNVFLKFFYGFLVSSGLFFIIALIAISQFKFTQ
ncbi:MAG: hypothetical protein Q8Q89_03300 [bacterium]|nr:hypothetical protein [bacterium]